LSILPKSTAAILAYKNLNRNIDKFWIDWAVEMLMSGFDTENLVILAGISPPYDQFELQSLTNKVLEELRLDYSNREKTIRGYVRYLIQTGTAEELDVISSLKILRELRDLYYELDYDNSILTFYNLYYGLEDLQHDDVQWYVDGMDKDNMLSFVKNTFGQWLREN
jgi:hypothetical protein